MSTLLADLQAKGLLSQILAVLCTGFGRTPKSQRQRRAAPQRGVHVLVGRGADHGAYGSFEFLDHTPCDFNPRNAVLNACTDTSRLLTGKRSFEIPSFLARGKNSRIALARSGRHWMHLVSPVSVIPDPHPWRDTCPLHEILIDFPTPSDSGLGLLPDPLPGIPDNQPQ